MFSNKDRTLSLLLILTLFFSIFTIYVYSHDSPPDVSAKSAALFEPETRKFLYLKNEHKRLPMASTTKIMTALIACESLDPKKEVLVDDAAIGIDGSSIYLEKGETLSALDLIYALMLGSANDAAVALAIEIAESVDNFSLLMNDRCKSIGAFDTHFENPHGLDAENHYTSAHDLALISAEALKNPLLREIISTWKKEIKSSKKSRVLVNHNKLLKNYEGCIGIKTGYTQKSGRSLVGAAKRDGLTLISVTIDAPDDWNDHKKLLNYGFSRIHSKTLLDESELDFELPILNANTDTVKLSFKEPLKFIYEGALPKIDKEIKLNGYLIAPVSRGDVVGKILFTSDGKVIAETDIIAEESINSNRKRNFYERFIT